MDNVIESLMDIVNNAFKSAFSHGSTQHRDCVELYYQQPTTSTNTMFSYDQIQQQGYEEPGAFAIENAPRPN
jgi:hypothetical protein